MRRRNRRKESRLRSIGKSTKRVKRSLTLKSKYLNLANSYSP